VHAFVFGTQEGHSLIGQQIIINASRGQFRIFWSVYIEQTGLGNDAGLHPWMIKEGRRSTQAQDKKQ
jgi:hypothetical protein